MANKKFPGEYLLGLSILSGIVAVILGAILLKQYGPKVPVIDQPKNFISDPFIDQMVSMENKVTGGEKLADTTSIPTLTAADVQDISLEKPELQWMTYEQIDLDNQPIEIVFSLACEGGTITLPSFSIIPWYEGVFENGDFAIGKNTAVAWEHLGHHGLWLHSGLDAKGNPLSAYPIQAILERDGDGNTRDAEDFEKHLQECIIGSRVIIQQGGVRSESRLVAGIRVPSNGVEELSTHVMDLVPYLAKEYPGYGFETLRDPGLLLYFCGRRLSYEALDNDSGYWTQARIILALQPEVIFEGNLR